MIDNKENNIEANVPYIVYESSQARLERQIKRQTVIIVILILSVLICNGLWLYFWNQYDYNTSEANTVSFDNDNGAARFINIAGGSINAGENSTHKDDIEKEEER